MRLRTLVTAVLVAVAAITGSVGVSHITLTGNGSLGSSGSLDFGSSADDVVGPVSGFSGRTRAGATSSSSARRSEPWVRRRRSWINGSARLQRARTDPPVQPDHRLRRWDLVVARQRSAIHERRPDPARDPGVADGQRGHVAEHCRERWQHSSHAQSDGADGAVIVTNGFHMQRAMKNFRDAARAQRARITFMSAYA